MSCSFSPLWLFSVFLSAFVSLSDLQAQDGEKEETETEKEVGEQPAALEAMPFRFPQVMTDEGFRFGVTSDGALALTEGDWVEDGMRLSVNGSNFRPDSAITVEGQPMHYQITGKAGDVPVTRDVYIDPKRGGVRYLDIFEGKPDGWTSLKISLASTFNSSNIKALKLLDDNQNPYAVMASSSKAVSQFLFITNGVDDYCRKPEVATEESPLKFTYEVKIAEGGRAALLHWVVQRQKNPDHSEEQSLLDLTASCDAFYKKHRLLDSRVDSSLGSLIVNFAEGATEDDGFFAPNKQSLVAVGELESRLDVERLDEDVLWVGNGSVLNGHVEGDELSVGSQFGKVVVPLVEVAAIQGGGGKGRRHRLYLRDGSVLGGEVSAPGLRLSGKQGWGVSIDIGQMEYLLCRLRREDGEVSGDIDRFISFHDGDTVAVGLGAGQSLTFLSPWGEVELPVAEVEALRYIRLPSPRYQVQLTGGSSLTGFLVDGELLVASPRLGEHKVKVTSVQRLWDAASPLRPDETDTVEIEWFDEIEPALPTDRPFCLLVGGNLLGGEIVDTELGIVSGATVTTVFPSEVLSLRRDEDVPGESAPQFVFELSGGSTLKGHLSAPVITIRSGRMTWAVPVQHFLAMRQASEE